MTLKSALQNLITLCKLFPENQLRTDESVIRQATCIVCMQPFTSLTR